MKAKWEETVKRECLCDRYAYVQPRFHLEVTHCNECNAYYQGQLAQAKITWEARDKLAKEEVEQAEKRGYNKGVEDKLGMEDALQQRNDELRAEVAEAEQRGAKKVADWIDFDCLPYPQPFEGKGEPTGHYVGDEQLQAFLKSIEVNSKEK